MDQNSEPDGVLGSAFLFCVPLSGHADWCGWLQNKKGQKPDEGVPRASDPRSRLELHESASPIAFAEHPHFTRKQSLYQNGIGKNQGSCFRW